MKNLDQKAASSIRTYSTNTSSEKFETSAWNTNSNFLLYLTSYLLCLDIKLKNNMKNKIAIIIAAALFKCARYLVKKKTEMCKNELQGIRMQRSTREEQKTDVLLAIQKIQQPVNKYIHCSILKLCQN